MNTMIDKLHDDFPSTMAELADLMKQQAALTTIREELCDELLACPPRSRNRAELDRMQGLKLSILCIDGRFDLPHKDYLTDLPLFDKLRQSGYLPTAANPMAALYRPLPAIARRLAVLQQRHDEPTAAVTR